MGDSNTADEGLTSLDLWERDADAPCFCLGCYHTLQCSTITSFSPWVKVVNYRFAIDSYIEDAHTFIVIFFATTFSVPGFCEV